MSRELLKIHLVNTVFTILLIFFSAKVYAEEKNKDCYVESAGHMTYAVNYRANVSDIVSNTGSYAVVGTIYAKETSFKCPSSRFEWQLQIQPKAISISENPTICKTNIRGVGIQYLNNSGLPINCNSWDYIFAVPAGSTRATLKEGAVLARIIRTNEALESNGTYQLNLPASFLAYYYGGTNSTAWGDFILQNGRVYISTFAPEIYFPDSPYSPPIIRLNINKKHPGSNSSPTQDSVTLDMCLYDGSNSTSKGVKLTFNDNTSGVSARPTGLFSIFRRNGDNSQISNRIDYVVSIINPVTGSRQEINNGVEIYWEGTNTRRFLRQVILPNIPGVSLCVPAPVTFSASSLNISEKIAGNYFGTLTVIYSPST